jgi:hypothetical protein
MMIKMVAFKNRGPIQISWGRCLFPILLTITFFLITSCARESEPTVTVVPRNVDKLILAGGGVIQGEIVEETESQIRIKWQDGVVGFHPSEVERIERSAASDAQAEGQDDLYVPIYESEEEKARKWPEGMDHFVWLTKGEKLGGTIKKATGGWLTLRQNLEGGGAIEHDFKFEQIEKIALWPPSEEDAQARLAEFMKKYPHSDLLQEEYYNIISTEQDPADLRRFLRTLNQFYHEFLLNFFELIDLSHTHPPLDVLMLGTKQEFQDELVAIGFNPKSSPIGFYHFEIQKLVVYNAKSEMGVQMRLMQGQAYRSQLDEQAAQSPELLAQAERAKEHSAAQELKMLGQVLKQNKHVVRHEGGHQLFHLLGVTPLEVYSGGWLIEGLALYCETIPIGAIHPDWSMLLRYESEEGGLMPLSYLFNFAKGSGFHRLDPQYAKVAYAQSWAFIHFLMTRGYRNAFMSFLKEMRTMGPEFDAIGEQLLLEKHLGKKLTELDSEYVDYMKSIIHDYVDEKTYQDYRHNLLRV